MTASCQAKNDWHVIVLAADRGASDPVAHASGVDCKALAPIAGRPMLAHVLTTLSQSRFFETISVVGPTAAVCAANPALSDLFDQHDARWIEPRPRPVASVLAALEAIDPEQPTLITTADHVLLDQAMIAAMCQPRPGIDLSVALVSHALVQAAFPNARRTVTRLGGRGFCGCNLFALRTPRGRRLIERWQRIENQRKHPARVVAGMLGGLAVLRYALGWLSLDAAFDGLSRRHGLNVAPMLLDDPRASVDVDSVADWQAVDAMVRAGR